MRHNWTYKKLGEVVNCYRGLTYSKADEVPTSSKRVLRSNNIDLDTHALNFDEIKCVRENLPIAEDKKLKKDSIFICMSNGSMQHLGKVAYVDKDYDYAFGGFMGLIIPNPQEVFPKYVYYSLLAPNFLATILREGRGANINNLRFSDLENYSLLIPSFDEQISIVQELDGINHLVNLQEQQLREYDNLAQSLFYSTFGDPLTNPKGWEVKKLRDVAREKLSYGSGASAVVFDGNTRYVRITDIKNDGELNNDIVSPNLIEEKYLLNEGDILFARSGATVGKTYMHKNSNGHCIYAGYLIRLIPNEDIALPVYLFNLTKTEYYRSFIASEQRTVAQPNINAQQYGDFGVPLPPLELQQSFAAQIEAIEKQKALIRKSLDETRTLLAARMQYYFE